MPPPPKRRPKPKAVQFRHHPPNVIIWGGVSTASQAAEDKASMDDQLEVLESSIASLKWNVIDVILVPGFSRNFFTYQEFCEAAAAEGMTDPQKMWKYWVNGQADIIATINISRLGREQSIVDEFVGRTYNAGMFLYTSKNGLVAPEQRRTTFMIEGYSSATEIEDFTRKRDFGMRNRVDIGLTTGKTDGHFHHYTWDRGDKVKSRGADGSDYLLTVDREKYQRLIDDLYQGYVDKHIPVNSLEKWLFEEIKPAHVREDGTRYYAGFFSEEMWKPQFHGAIAFHRFYVRERWVVSEAYAHEAPPDAKINYHACEPVYPGEKGEKFRLEMFRRQSIHGKARPNAIHIFSGLLRCAECGASMVRHVMGKNRNTYYYCPRQYLNNRGHVGKSCSNRKAVREEVLISFMTGWLESLDRDHAGVSLDRFYHPTESQRPETLSREQQQLQGRIDTLVNRIADPRLPAAVLEDIYAQLAALTEQRDKVAKHQAEVAASEMRRQQHETIIQAADVSKRLHTLWDEPEVNVNQYLNLILGDARIFCRDGIPVEIRLIR